VVQDKNNLTVVALLFDKATGAILNANKARVGQASSTGISELKAELVGSVIKTELYDLTGKRVINPRRGVYVRMETLSDGSINKTKVKY
jgi:hypothetical protein